MSANGKFLIVKLPYIILILAWLWLGYLTVWPAFMAVSKDNSADLAAIQASKKTPQESFVKSLETLLQSPQFLRLTETPENISWLEEPANPSVAMPGLAGQELVGRNNPFVLPNMAEVFVATSTPAITSAPEATTTP